MAPERDDRYQTELSLKLDALTAAREMLSEDPTEALGSVRRIIHSLKDFGERFNHAEIVKASTWVSQAPDAAIPRALDALLSLLGREAEEHTGGVKILVIDSDDGIRQSVKERLSSVDGEIVFASTAAEGEKLLGRPGVGVIVLELRLPDDDGRNLLVKFKERPETSEIPVIVYTSMNGKLTEKECYALGADRFIEKAGDPELLSTAVTGALTDEEETSQETLEPETKPEPVPKPAPAPAPEAAPEPAPEPTLDPTPQTGFQSEPEAKSERALEPAPAPTEVAAVPDTAPSLHDVLTGLPSRAAFTDEYERAQAQAVRFKEPLSLAIIEIGRLPEISGKYSTAVADRVVVDVAAASRKLFYRSDVMARWSESEFVVLFLKTPPENAKLGLVKIQSAIKELKFAEDTQQPFRAAVYAGVTSVASDATLEDSVASAKKLLEMAYKRQETRVVSRSDIEAPTKRKIIYAEDDKVTASLVKHYFERNGFDVEHYFDGVAALQAIKKSDAAIIILDVRMPEMDGFEVLSQLRSDPKHTHTPVIMLTSLTKDKDLQRGFTLGADEYIPKPFSLVELNTRVQRILKKT